MSTVKKLNDQQTITISMQELILQNVDRTRADLRKWWRKLQIAEQISYPKRSGLYDLYERSKLDGHLSGVVEKRVTAVLNKKLHYEVNGKRIEVVDEFINSAKFRLMMRKLWEKKMWGISGLDFIVGENIDFTEIPRKHIKPESTIITREQDGDEGLDYSKEPFVFVVEDVERFGLMLKSVPYTILKSGSLSDLAQYIELYGQPIRKGTYPAGDPELKAELGSALKESGASLSVLLPEGTSVEIIGDHVTAGNGQVHDVMFKQCNNELSILWLGNVETTGSDNGGSNAKSKVHSDQQKEIIKSDMLDMQDMLSDFKLQTILKSYGIPLQPGVGRFIFEKEFDLEMLKNRKDIDIALSGKIPISDDYFYETYGIPKPDNYDELKAQMEEERKMKLQPPVPPPAAPAAKPPKKKKLSAENKLTFLEKLRATLADFFDPGHKA